MTLLTDGQWLGLLILAIFTAVAFYLSYYIGAELDPDCEIMRKRFGRRRTTKETQ
ncbi:MAG: hypothetical protein HOA17_03880 [Candidatus Melainabacteria bacterium]|jgi:hypothetical protein|nr:hypothetical protein [Candidatus Melainabacteria bacterium]